MNDTPREAVGDHVAHLRSVQSSTEEDAGACLASGGTDMAVRPRLRAMHCLASSVARKTDQTRHLISSPPGPLDTGRCRPASPAAHAGMQCRLAFLHSDYL